PLQRVARPQCGRPPTPQWSFPAISPQTEPLSPSSAAFAERDSPTRHPGLQSRFARTGTFASDLHARGLCVFTREIPDGGQVARFRRLLSMHGVHGSDRSQPDAQRFTQRSATDRCFMHSTMLTESPEIAIFREISVE